MRENWKIKGTISHLSQHYEHPIPRVGLPKVADVQLKNSTFTLSVGMSILKVDLVSISSNPSFKQLFKYKYCLGKGIKIGADLKRVNNRPHD
ncbi:hypothetical protein BJP34_20505 [Moorena producens PAL-8-15-08-1]|uniref:Uncharacterized protein n=1 Tax=Moorena producens PAL-8-15-08-1 TaxID=1458985 RepID=A0A1D8TV36_9CYAN|nr:hypothetical protein BJP34_20505 [Moorena producens PAL-8-15-08-1]